MTAFKYFQPRRGDIMIAPGFNPGLTIGPHGAARLQNVLLEYNPTAAQLTGSLTIN